MGLTLPTRVIRKFYLETEPGCDASRVSTPIMFPPQHFPTHDPSAQSFNACPKPVLQLLVVKRQVPSYWLHAPLTEILRPKLYISVYIPLNGTNFWVLRTNAKHMDSSSLRESPEKQVIMRGGRCDSAPPRKNWSGSRWIANKYRPPQVPLKPRQLS